MVPIMFDITSAVALMIPSCRSRVGLTGVVEATSIFILARNYRRIVRACFIRRASSIDRLPRTARPWSPAKTELTDHRGDPNVVVRDPATARPSVSEDPQIADRNAPTRRSD